MPSNPPPNTPAHGGGRAPANGSGNGPNRTTLVLQIALQALLVIHAIINTAGGGSGC